MASGFAGPVTRKASNAHKVHHKGANFPDTVHTMRTAVFTLALAHEAPVYLLSYEGLVQDPEAVGRDLFEWLSLPWVAWPVEAYANPETPERGRLFDGNRKWLDARSGGSTG